MQRSDFSAAKPSIHTHTHTQGQAYAHGSVHGERLDLSVVKCRLDLLPIPGSSWQSEFAKLLSSTGHV